MASSSSSSSSSAAAAIAAAAAASKVSKEKDAEAETTESEDDMPESFNAAIHRAGVLASSAATSYYSELKDSSRKSQQDVFAVVKKLMAEFRPQLLLDQLVIARALGGIMGYGGPDEDTTVENRYSDFDGLVELASNRTDAELWEMIRGEKDSKEVPDVTGFKIPSKHRSWYSRQRELMEQRAADRADRRDVAWEEGEEAAESDSVESPQEKAAGDGAAAASQPYVPSPVQPTDPISKTSDKEDADGDGDGDDDAPKHKSKKLKRGRRLSVTPGSPPAKRVRKALKSEPEPSSPLTPA